MGIPANSLQQSIDAGGEHAYDTQFHTTAVPEDASCPEQVKGREQKTQFNNKPTQR